MSRTFSTAIAVVSIALLAASKNPSVPPDPIVVLESEIAGAPGVTDNLRHPLTVKLEAARAALAKDKTSVACIALGDFRDQVVEKRGKGIPTGTADEWLATVGQISTAVGCSIVC
jgi:hypothetical protein